MAGEDLIYAIPSGLLTLFKALGWAIIFYVIFNIINMFLNKKKNKQVEQINKNLEEIKKLLKKKK